MALYGLYSAKNYCTCFLKIPGDLYCNQLSENMFKVCVSWKKSREIVLSRSRSNIQLNGRWKSSVVNLLIYYNILEKDLKKHPIIAKERAQHNIQKVEVRVRVLAYKKKCFTFNCPSAQTITHYTNQRRSRVDIWWWNCS